jgi:5-methylcytosine-specific restriction endonuclease McrA
MDLIDRNIFYGECSSKHGFNLHVYFTGEFEISYWTNVLPEYKEYISSDEWKEKSKHAKEKAEWKCQLCNKSGTNKTLHTHHRTYENLGNEKDGDLIVLCQSCHEKFHRKDYI